MGSSTTDVQPLKPRTETFLVCQDLYRMVHTCMGSLEHKGLSDLSEDEQNQLSFLLADVADFLRERLGHVHQ